MSKPVATRLIMPDDTKPVNEDITVGETSALTILPISGNKVFYYHGYMDQALQKGAYGVTTFYERWHWPGDPGMGNWPWTEQAKVRGKTLR